LWDWIGGSQDHQDSSPWLRPSVLGTDSEPVEAVSLASNFIAKQSSAKPSKPYVGAKLCRDLKTVIASLYLIFDGLEASEVYEAPM